MNKIKEIKESLDTIKDLKSKFSGIDMSNPQAMIDSMGINMDEMEDFFIKSNDYDSIKIKKYL